MLQRRNRSTEITLLHIGLAETEKPIRKGRLKFGDFAKFRDGNVEFLLFVRRNSRLHVLGRLWRERLRCKP